MADRSLSRICNRFRASLRSVIFRLGLSRVLVFVALTLLLLIFVDWRAHLSVGARTACLLLLLAGSFALIYFELLRPLRHRWTNTEVLNYLDTVVPESNDSLINLMELQEPERVQEASSEVGRKIVDDAVTDLSPFVKTVKPSAAVNRGPVGRWQRIALVAIIIAVLPALIFPKYAMIGLLRLFLPFAHIKWPHETYLEVVEPETGWTVAKGDSFTVKGRIRGIRPDQLELHYRSANHRRWIKEYMFMDDKEREDEKGDFWPADFTFSEVSHPLEFYLTGGDDTTKFYELSVVARPEISHIKTTYWFPAYSKVPPKITKSGQISGLEGTKVNIQFTASKDLAKAVVKYEWPDEPIKEKGPEGVEIALDSPMTFHLDLILEKSGSYSIELLDKDGLREEHAETYLIDVTPDNPPIARIVEPAKDIITTAKGKAFVKFKVEDDFGLDGVEFIYELDHKNPTKLTDHITGPIAQKGKLSERDFWWYLDKMDLKGAKYLSYYVKAKDVNPTGKGLAESTHYQMSVLTPTEYQAQLVLDAKVLATEARIGFTNQKFAYFDGKYWLSGPEGEKESPRILNQMKDEQNAAARAARALLRRFSALKGCIEQNQLQVEFMSPRLSLIEGLINKILDERIASIDKALEDAKPKTEDEDRPAARTAKMRKHLSAIQNTQGYTTLEFLRVLNRILDWLDLQNVFVKTKKMAILQEEVNSDTQVITPRFIGKEIEDLTDEDAGKLALIAQQQKSLYEAETALEKELTVLIGKSEMERRLQIFKAFRQVFGALKSNRVNDKMRKASEAIEDNRCDTIIPDQKTVMKALKKINDALIAVGKDIVPEKEPVLGQLALLSDERKVEAETIALGPDKKIPTTDLKGKEWEFGTGEVPLDEDVKADTLEGSVKQMQSLQEEVRDRTTYLKKRLEEKKKAGRARSGARYKRLKMAMLNVRQDRVVEASNKAVTLAGKHECKRVEPYIKGMKSEIDGIKGMLEGEDLSGFNTDLQLEVAESVKNVRRFLYDRSREKMRLEERLKRETDDFDRRFLLSGDNMKGAFRVFEDLAWARVLQAEVNRKCERLGRKYEGFTDLHKKISEDSLKKATVKQDRVIETLGKAQKIAAEEMKPYEDLTEALKLDENDPRKRVQEEVLKLISLEDFKKSAELIRQGKFGKELREQQKLLAKGVFSARRKVTELTDIRMAQKEEPPPTEEVIPDTPPVAEGEDLEKKIEDIRERFSKAESPAELIRRVKESDLPGDMKNRIVASLERIKKDGFDAKYQKLLAAYFLAMIEKKK